MTRDWYIRHGVDKNRIVVTGRMAAVRKDVTSNVDSLRRSINIPLNKKVVLLSTQPAVSLDSLVRIEGNTPLVQSIIDQLFDLEDVMLIVKLHPGEEMSDYGNVVKDDNKVLITKQADAQDYLEICDVLIVGDSSIAVDAMIKGKPVIYINFEGSEDLVPYPKYGAYPAYKKEDIRPLVKRILYNDLKAYDEDNIRNMVVCEGKGAVQKAFDSIIGPEKQAV
jgi:UDP-N-acetylglucosamine 2-epimerase